MTLDEAKYLLLASGILFDSDRRPDDEPEDRLPDWSINLNDAFFWGTADLETIPEDELVKVANLFRSWGLCGVYFWVCEKRGYKTVEFLDINRHVHFVREEEALRATVEYHFRLPYHKHVYTLGEEKP